MDGFGDNFVPNGDGDSAVAPVDPAAEFLAREQEELSGLEDPPTVDAEPEAESDQDPEPISTPSGSLFIQNGVTDDLSDTIIPQVHETAPSISPQRTPERVVTPIPRIEPEAIRVWREQHQKELVDKDAAEETAKDTLKEKAKQELADWYKQHEEQVAKTRQANRCAEKELVADTERPEPGTEWERISKLCDFNPKTAKSSRDVSRMRSIILHVKQSPPVKA